MAGPTDAVRLAELLCARISHDLGGVIGTLTNAFELAADDPTMAAEALELAGQAAGELRRRLEWLRAAWGPAGGTLSVPALRALAEGMPKPERVTLDLTGLPSGRVLPPDFARGLLNLLLLAAESLGGRGVITVVDDADAVLVGIAGPRAAWPNEFLACLANNGVAWDAVRDARSILPPLVVLLVRASGLRLTVVAPASGESQPRLRLAQG